MTPTLAAALALALTAGPLAAPSGSSSGARPFAETWESNGLKMGMPTKNLEKQLRSLCNGKVQSRPDPALPKALTAYHCGDGKVAFAGQPAILDAMTYRGRLFKVALSATAEGMAEPEFRQRGIQLRDDLVARFGKPAGGNGAEDGDSVSQRWDVDPSFEVFLVRAFTSRRGPYFQAIFTASKVQQEAAAAVEGQGKGKGK